MPEPRLLPADPRAAAQVRLFEELANAVIAPEGRQLVIGRMLAVTDERLVASGRTMAEKYGHSPYVERRARGALGRALSILAEAIEGRRYLVGDVFTRADLTVAAMLLDAVPPPEELFECQPPFMRALMTDELLGREPRFAPVFAWRDRVYREHRC